VLLTRYFCFVGAALLGLLLLAGWYWPSAPERFSKDESSATSSIDQAIHIRSAQRWPDKVVMDTNVPTIVPPLAPPAMVTQAASPPVQTAERSPVDAHAELRPEPPVPPRKRIARVHHRSPRSRASEYAYASPPTAPSWSFGW
jgi:hypothetical protein